MIRVAQRSASTGRHQNAADASRLGVTLSQNKRVFRLLALSEEATNDSGFILLQGGIRL